MSIPITRTKRSIPKSRGSNSSSKERVRVTNPHSTIIKNSSSSSKISFINPFTSANDRDADEKVRLVNPVEYISPRTTPPNSPPTTRRFSSVLRLPPSPKDMSPYDDSFAGTVTDVHGMDQLRNGHKSRGEIPRPRRLSKEEVDIHLLNGKSVLSTHMTVNGITIIEKRSDIKSKGCLPCYEKQKGDEKVKLVSPSFEPNV